MKMTLVELYQVRNFGRAHLARLQDNEEDDCQLEKIFTIRLMDLSGTRTSLQKFIKAGLKSRNSTYFMVLFTMNMIYKKSTCHHCFKHL